MTVAEWCIFGSIMLALLTIAPVKPLAGREFDNANPRDPQFYEKPVRRRALGAHINGLETFPFFAVSILLAEFRHSPQSWVDALAVAFMLARIAFVVAYIGDRSTLRTILWNIGMAFNLAIFFLSGFGKSGALVVTLLGLLFALFTGLVLVVSGRTPTSATGQGGR
ncbi:MAG: MAPEG family protein [Sphingomicrobium sp.]